MIFYFGFCLWRRGTGDEFCFAGGMIGSIGFAEVASGSRLQRRRCIFGFTGMAEERERGREINWSTAHLAFLTISSASLLSFLQ